MSVQLTPAAQNKLNTVRDLFTSCQKQIAAALPRHMTAERMARIAFSACQRQPKLMECTPQSLALSVINASELGCEPGLNGEAYLVPYKTTCQLIIGYKGLMKLARNSGMVKSFQVAIVREGDKFEYERGSSRYLKHVENGDNGDAPITHVWAGAMVEGEFEFEVMTIAQIEKIRKRSRASSDGPWVTDYEEMCKKTVIRRFCKLLPQSPELARAVALDEHAEAGLPQTSDLVDLGTAEELEPTSTGAGAQIEQKLASKGKTKPDTTSRPACPPYDNVDAVTKALSELPEHQQEAYQRFFNASKSEGNDSAHAHESAWLTATGMGC